VSALFAAGMILLAAAAAAGLAITAPGRARSVPYALGAAGSACLAVAGGFALAGRTVRLNVAGWLGDPLPGQQALGLSADRMSGMFLVMALGAAVPVSVAFASWAARQKAAATRMLAEGYALALGATVVIVTMVESAMSTIGRASRTAGRRA